MGTPINDTFGGTVKKFSPLKKLFHLQINKATHCEKNLTHRKKIQEQC